MTPAIIIQPVTARDLLPLRHALLRPHQPEETCVFPGDNDPTTIHLGAFMLDEMIGIASLYQESHKTITAGSGFRLRGLAIKDALRRRGYGQALLQAVEEQAQAQGADYLWANARITALDFYAKAGYSIGEEEFIVPGVGPHRLVRRDFK